VGREIPPRVQAHVRRDNPVERRPRDAKPPIIMRRGSIIVLGTAIATGCTFLAGGTRESPSSESEALGLPPPSDAGFDTRSFFDADADDAGRCNEFSPRVAPDIEQSAVGTARPPATGGRLIDGLYFRTADTVFRPGEAGGPTGLRSREAIYVIDATTAKPLLASSFVEYGTNETPNFDAPTTERATFIPVQGGAPGAVTLSFVCPDFGDIATSYSVRTVAGKDVLDIYRDEDRIETFTRQ
jgi:hypothetical protein